MEKTFVLIKPDTIQRGLIGKIINKFESKGLKLVGIKMIKLNNEILKIHYSHLSDKPFFNNIVEFMKSTPVILTCWEGISAVEIVRKLCGVTNARNAELGTIRGDFSISQQTNLVHASDTIENAEIELNRFFRNEEIFEYKFALMDYLYSIDEQNK